jgi:anti-sigma B factor antagonist
VTDERIKHFAAEVVQDADRTLLVLQGEVDMSTAGEFADALDAAVNGGTGVEIDLRAVTFMDSSGLAVLASAHQRLGQGAIVLREPNRTVRSLLRVSGVGSLVDVRVDEERPDAVPS